MKKIRETLRKAILESGAILSAAIRKPKKIRYKGRANLVTETDKLAEKRIIEIIRKNFPHHSILAEESETGTVLSKTLSFNKFGKNRPLRPVPRITHPSKWIIDPVDGTSNFAHGLPIAAVSIAYEEGGEILLGSVFNPFSNEWFSAEKGKGAFLNGKRIRVSDTKKLEAALLVTGFPYDRTKYAHRYLKIVEAFMRTTHGIRRLGSASLD
jgi:myo-inositol-1(or 4)-monophosphatase